MAWNGRLIGLLSRLASAFLVAWLAAPLAGQTVSAQPEGNGPPPGEGRAMLAPPPIRLGVRAATVQAKLPVARILVVVPDAASYLEALRAWSLEARFPVLIDDGTWVAREDVARFARAFRPERVVRFRASDAPWPLDPVERRAVLERVVAGAWGVETFPALLDRWKEMKLVPFGVVAMDPRHAAWTAGVALAAGRGQLIAWTMIDENVSGTMSVPMADAVSEACEKASDAAGLSWQALGDDIEAVTLALNSANKINFDPKDPQKSGAATDFIGRRRTGDDPSKRMVRWAWAGQVHGGEARAAYAAMCALFLAHAAPATLDTREVKSLSGEEDAKAAEAAPGGVARAWLFDGYEDKAPFSDWDVTKASAEFERRGVPTTLDDAPKNGLRDWRARASNRPGSGPDVADPPFFGVDADLVCINTAGNADFFELKPGRGLSGDVPFTLRPAMIHFVHSWSAFLPGDRTTIAGRWFEHGAYAYVGSVSEPYLQAFQPTPIFAGRLMGGGTWGAAGRLDGSNAWRIAVFGDPLIVLGPPGPPAAATASARVLDALKGSVDTAADLAERLKSGEYASALWSLAYLGRDADADRLVRALLKDKPETVTPEVAAAGAGALFRTGDRATIVAALGKAAKETAGKSGWGVPKFFEETPALRDVVWHALYTPTPVTGTREAVELLARAVRPEMAKRDGDEAVAAAERLLGQKGAKDIEELVKSSLGASKAK
ncbi:MAG: hypothetical protein JNM07_10320 [Phycisphaerae bacterium]|nr:hypothetical protein [Phycisphaerae bacterium]